MNLHEYSAEEDLRDALRRTQRQLADAKAKVDDLVDATVTAAKDATLALGPVRAPRLTSGKQGKGRPEVAVWHMTDWQGAKRTVTYDSNVMRDRALRFCEKARKITTVQRSDHPVNECFILFGGDMIEGLFNFPSQPFEIDSTLFQQYVTVSRLMVDVVMYALATYEHVTVVAEWGNHGRIGSKAQAVPRADNFDRMCYELARQLLANESRLTWDDCPEDIQYVEIGNYNALLIHGDEIGRNGSASPQTIVRTANQWRSGSYPKPFRDIYVGHFHTHNEWSMANGIGAVFQTGSLESDNTHALVTMGASATPTQRLHFVDPEDGFVTSQYKIYVS